MVHINVTSNWGSTGRICEGICCIAESNGWKTYVAYGRHLKPGKIEAIKIGSISDTYKHLLASRLFDRQGLYSSSATEKFIRQLSIIHPDIIHLHNIHGYYLNYEILFDYIKSYNIHVVWTLHDCWPFTGHCVYFDEIGCNLWIHGCHDCPQINSYPASFLIDQSRQNWEKKREVFTSHKNITFVPVSNWIAGYLQQSFFKNYPYQVIHNGIDLDIFKPIDNAKQVICRKYGIEVSKKIVLGVASRWDARKGYGDFIKLSQILDNSKFTCIIVGINDKQSKTLPLNIVGIKRTENAHELAALYSAADVFVNPTYSDTYPTTNLESIACGTPVITYRTGGSPESITPKNGLVVEKGDLERLSHEIIGLTSNDKKLGISNTCINYAQSHFDKNKCFEKYLAIYNQLT